MSFFWNEPVDRFTVRVFLIFMATILATVTEAFLFHTISSFFIGGFVVLSLGVYKFNTYGVHHFPDTVNPDCAAQEFPLSERKYRTIIIFAVINTFIVLISTVVESIFWAEYNFTSAIWIVLLAEFYLVTFRW